MRLSKVQIPPMAANFIARPRLEDRAAQILGVPVTVVRAGGGFGKSTLLRAWAQRLGASNAVAWLSLEHHDASATGIVEAINVALARALPGLGNSATQMLDKGVEQFTKLVSALSNELFAWIEENDRDVVFFIDDIQFVVAEKQAIDTIGEFLRALPERAHVVLGSRSPLKFPPLSKMRASSAVFEVEEEDLRFTVAEATELLDEESTAELFVNHTEGWAIALGLTAQIVKEDPQGWRRAMSESRESIFDFLAEEVVERLPSNMQEQLLILAIPSVIDGLYAPQLLGDVPFEALIASMMQSGLYLSRIDEGTWRFHHLFRDFLLERFRRTAPSQRKDLQIRYAALLRQHGQKMEALGQLLDADDYEQIVEYVHEALQAIRCTDRYKSFLRLLSLVPDHVMKKNPMLHRFYGTALVRDGRDEQAKEQLALCYEQAVALGDVATACAAQMELGIFSDQFYYLRHGTFLKSEEHFQNALVLSQQPELAHRPVAHAIMRWHLGMALACRGAFDEAFGHLEIAESIERSLERHVDNILVEIAVVHGWTGNWLRSLDYAELAEELFRSGHGEVQIGRAMMAQAQAHLALHPTSSRCTQVAEAAVSILAADQPDELPAALVLLARARLNHAPPSVRLAIEALDQAASRLESNPNPVVSFEVAAARVEAYLLSGETELVNVHIGRAAVLATAMRNPWASAMVSFLKGLIELVRSDDVSARRQFSVAAAEFDAVGDRYHRALGDLSALACDVRTRSIEADRASAFLHFIAAEGLEYVCAGAPRSSMALLGWCLRHACDVELAESLIAPSLNTLGPELATIAQDASVPALSRAAALRIMAKAAPAEARKIIKTLCNDLEPLVAGTARATLDYLPNPEIARLHISVIGELQVGVAGEMIAEKDERFGRKRASELLRLLAVSRNALTKAAIMSALWPDTENVADATLRVTLHLLRRALQPGVDGSGEYVSYDGSLMRLNPDVFEGTDAEDGDSALRRAELLAARNEIQEARTAYNLAIHIYGKAPREEDVADWLRPHVRHWREQCMHAYHGLGRLERASGNNEAALRSTLQALTFDALNEETISLLLDLYGDLGELDAAKSAFVTYKRRLAEQLGSSPGPGLVERYTKILQKRQVPSIEQLSAREREVLGLVARGLSNKQIGAELSLSTWTVNNHVAKILKKLNVESRTAAAGLSGDL
ncbi:MAG: LuxR C-terminal-related transcriptional regulator [Candidatus Eremiobacteraeota bacterium]|nr:LuxR C-terminal-related transcriptional regulator [Candidatus Eremiobacteraeota bacterium]